MKVVELASLSRSAGGVFYSVSSLCKAMLQCGGNLAVMGRHDSFVFADQSGWGEVPTIAYNAFGPLQTSWRLRGMLRTHRPDLVHQHGIWLDDQWAALQWQRKTGNPVVVSPHGMLDPWAVQNSAWKKKIVGALFANDSLRKATCLHALSRSEAESIRAYGLKTPISIIPNGVELPDMEISNSKSGTAGRRKQLLFLGRIHPKKGLFELISGWARLRTMNPSILSEWQLLLAGWDDGGHLAGLQKQSDELGLTWSVEASPDAEICFLGPVFGESKAVLLHTADAFILPSFSEGLPMSVLEAWSYGLPVAMTDACNIPAGFACDAAVRIELGADALVQGVLEFLAMGAPALQEMGQRGRRLVEDQFTWDKIARDMLAVYEWCLGGHKPACILDR